MESSSRGRWGKFWFPSRRLRFARKFFLDRSPPEGVEFLVQNLVHLPLQEVFQIFLTIVIVMRMELGHDWVLRMCSGTGGTSIYQERLIWFYIIFIRIYCVIIEERVYPFVRGQDLTSTTINLQFAQSRKSHLKISAAYTVFTPSWPEESVALLLPLLPRTENLIFATRSEISKNTSGHVWFSFEQKLPLNINDSMKVSKG